MVHEIKKINENIQNSKLQELIDSLLQTKYNTRPDINSVIYFMVCEESDKNEKNNFVENIEKNY